MSASPALEGRFTEQGTQGRPALLGSRCTTCASVYFPKATGFCRNPACDGTEFEETELGSSGTVWSYTDAQYQPPPPYVPASDPYEPFALAAVEVPEGLVVLGQLAQGFGVADVKVGDQVELVVERAWTDEDGTERSMWKWRPAR